jgi:hypothetical protein
VVENTPCKFEIRVGDDPSRVREGDQVGYDIGRELGAPNNGCSNSRGGRDLGTIWWSRRFPVLCLARHGGCCWEPDATGPVARGVVASNEEGWLRGNDFIESRRPGCKILMEPSKII